jgi:hypothetical protein
MFAKDFKYINSLNNYVIINQYKFRKQKFVLYLNKYQTRTVMAFCPDWSLHDPLIGDGRNPAPVPIWLTKGTTASAETLTLATHPLLHSLLISAHMYCRTLSCWSQWQRRLQSGVRGAKLSRESNYATEILISTCRYKCGQPTSAVSKHSLPRLLNSLLTTAVVSELLTVVKLQGSR